MKLSKKHIQIFKTIKNNSFYKPTYRDHEPATTTLLKNGLIEWREDFKGVQFTEGGKKYIETFNIDLN